MIREKEVKTNKNKGDSEEVAGNYTHLESTSCVKHFRQVGFQPSRFGRQPAQGRGRPLLPLHPGLSQASGVEILQDWESYFFLSFFSTTDPCRLNVFNH